MDNVTLVSRYIREALTHEDGLATIRTQHGRLTDEGFAVRHSAGKAWKAAIQHACGSTLRVGAVVEAHKRALRRRKALRAKLAKLATL